MDEGKDFLDTLQDTIRQLRDEGLITNEQLEEGLEVPIEWFFSRGIDGRSLSRTMDNICKKVNPVYRKAPKNSYAINTIRIIEKNGEVVFQILGRDGWTLFNIGKQGFHQEGKIETFDSKEFIRELQTTMQESKKYKLQNRFENLSDKQIQEILRIMYDQKRQRNEAEGMAKSLSEMVENFGKYYKYLYVEKEQVKKQDIEVTSGGLIEQEEGKMPYPRSNSGSEEKKERVNEIYPFEDRDNFFRQLKPTMIISFDSMDEDKHIQRGAYRSYIYQNKRENGGYFIISEPYRGDKSCRLVYLTDEYIRDLQDGREDPNFWVNIARTYLEMSMQEFGDEKSTYIMRHRALDTYAAKLQYIVSGEKNPNVSRGVRYGAKIILSKLFDVQINQSGLKEIAGGVSPEQLAEARGVVIPKSVPERSQGGEAK